MITKATRMRRCQVRKNILILKMAEKALSNALGASAPPNASSLRPRQLRQTLRVSGRGSSAERFGSPAAAMKVIPRDQKIQFSVSRDQMVRFFCFLTFCPSYACVAPSVQRMSQCEIFSFLVKRSNLTQIFCLSQ